MVVLAQHLVRPMWVASSVVVENGVRLFGAPRKLMVNWDIVSDRAEMTAFGADYTEYRVVVASNDVLSDVKQLDVVWLETEPPYEADELAKTAEFFVQSKTTGAGGVTKLILKRRDGR